MAVEQTVWINGMSPADLGARSTRVVLGSTAAPALAFESLRIPNAQGVALTGLVSQDSREIRIAYRFDASTVEARGAELRAMFEYFLGTLSELRLGDDPDAVIDAVCVGGDFAPLGEPLRFSRTTGWITTRWFAPQATKRSRFAQVISFGSAPVLLELSGLPPHWELWVYGSVTDPVVTVRNRSGDVLHEMEFTATLGSTDYVRATSNGHRSFLSDDGEETEDHTILPDEDYPLLDPRVGASFEVSGGSGLIVWQNRWPL
jgi:hypothetical protein